MRKALCLGLVLLGTVFWSAVRDARGAGQHLFYIERSINKNMVMYDVDPTEDGRLIGTSPVVVYWVLENGERSEVNTIQRRLAYGIKSQERLGENRYRITLSALEEREITVKKTDDGYKAFVLIHGRETILERIYVECAEQWSGFPKVLYIDLFGRDAQSAFPVTERIVPHKQK